MPISNSLILDSGERSAEFDELAKPTLEIDLPIHADLRAFLAALEVELDGYRASPAHAGYLAQPTSARDYSNST